MQKRDIWNIMIRMILQFAATSKQGNHYYLVYNHSTIHTIITILQ